MTHRAPEPPEVAQIRQTLEAYQGPLPPKELLNWYEQRVPDAPERFLKMVEGQAEHRMSMERFVTRWNVWLALTGQIITAIIVLGFLAASVVIIVVNHASTNAVIGGSVLGGLDLTGLAALLITREVYNKSKQ